MPVKDGSILRARLVDGGCHSFISKKSGAVSANIKTDGSYTASYIQQALPAKGRASINMFDVGPGRMVKGLHPISLYIQLLK